MSYVNPPLKGDRGKFNQTSPSVPESDRRSNVDKNIIINVNGTLNFNADEYKKNNRRSIGELHPSRDTSLDENGSSPAKPISRKRPHQMHENKAQAPKTAVAMR